MDFFNSAVDVLQTLVIALGAGLGIWGVINLLEGYGNDNPGANAHVRYSNTQEFDRQPSLFRKINQKKAKLNLIIDIIAKIWYYKTKGDDANGLMKHTTKYNFLSKGGSP